MTNEQIFKLAPIGSKLPVLGKVIWHDKSSHENPIKVTEFDKDDYDWPSRQAIIEAIQLNSQVGYDYKSPFIFPLTIEKLLKAAPIGSELYGLGKVIRHDNRDCNRPIQVLAKTGKQWVCAMEIINAIFLTKYPELRPDQNEATDEAETTDDLGFTTADGFTVYPNDVIWDEIRKAFGNLIYFESNDEWAVTIDGRVIAFIEQPESNAIYKHKPAQTKTIEVPAEGFTTDWFCEKFPIGMDLGAPFGVIVRHDDLDSTAPIKSKTQWLDTGELINLYITKPHLFTSNTADNDKA